MLSSLSFFMFVAFAIQNGGCGKIVPESSTTTTSGGGGSTTTTTTTTTVTSSTTSTTYAGWQVVTGTKFGTQETMVGSDFSNSSNRVTPALGAGIAGEFGVSFVSSDEGWAVGNEGDVLRTKNGFITTTVPTAEFINCGSSGRLQDVVAYTSNRIWVSGRDTTNGGSSVFYTGDAGKTWSAQVNTQTLYPGNSVHSSDRFNMLSFVVEGTNIYGWTAGGLSDNSSIIFKTTNGTSWEESYHSSIPPGGTINQFFSIAFADKNVGMAVGYNGTILATTNGGTTWTSQESGTTKTLYEVRMSSSTEAVAAGENGVVLRTTNGGTTWTVLTTGVTTALYGLDVRGSKIWVGGDGGKMYYSSNNGSSWTEQTSNTNQAVNAISMLTDTYGWAVCGQTTANSGSILRTLNGGN